MKLLVQIPGLIFCLSLTISVIFLPLPAKADIWGGDVAVLVQILSTTMEELIQLRAILGSGQDTLGLLQDVNSGIKNGLEAVHILHPGFDPGLFGELKDPAQFIQALRELYGEIPKTSNGEIEQAQDKTIAENFSMTRKMVEFADGVDHERERILNHAQFTNPQGSAKLTNQALAVLIGVNAQVLRSNAAILKLLAQNMAVQNKEAKSMSDNFKHEYEDMGEFMHAIPANFDLIRKDNL